MQFFIRRRDVAFQSDICASIAVCEDWNPSRTDGLDARQPGNGFLQAIAESNRPDRRVTIETRCDRKLDRVVGA